MSERIRGALHNALYQQMCTSLHYFTSRWNVSALPLNLG